MSSDAGLLVVSLDPIETLGFPLSRADDELVEQHLQRVLKGCLRSEDGVLRWGRGEFMILLPSADSVRAADVAELLVMAVRLQPVRLVDGRLLRLTCSVGWSTFDWGCQPNEPAWYASIAVADAALGQAQELGGDCSAAPSWGIAEERRMARTASA